MGFAAAAVLGTVAGNDGTTVLWRALMVMAACWLVGRVVGLITHQSVREHIEQYKEQRPIPDPNAQLNASGEANVDVEEDDAASTQQGAHETTETATEAKSRTAASST